MDIYNEYGKTDNLNVHSDDKLKVENDVILY